MYEGIFCKIVPPLISYYPLLYTPPLIESWRYGIIVILYLASVSSQHLYQDMQKYVVIVLMNITWSKPSEKFIHSITCILFEGICV